MMKRLKFWLFKKIVESEIIQGPEQDKKIQNLYRIIRDVAEDKFYEDNDPTLNAFLSEMFEESMKKG